MPGGRMSRVVSAAVRRLKPTTRSSSAVSRGYCPPSTTKPYLAKTSRAAAD
jgi:hypothetical protein